MVKYGWPEPQHEHHETVVVTLGSEVPFKSVVRRPGAHSTPILKSIVTAEIVAPDGITSVHVNPGLDEPHPL